MAYESQGVVIRRESSVAGATALLSTNTIGFEGTSRVITRQAGFADFSTGMRVEVNASLNSGIYTIASTAATAITVYEALTDQASGSTITMLGHSMQNIGQIVSFNGPALQANVIDITNLQSTAKEKIVGIVDGGQLSISALWDNEASNARLHDALARDMVARTNRRFDIKFTDNGSVSNQPSAVYFEGYVSAFSPTGSVDNALKVDLTIAISTGIDWISPV